MNKKNIKINQIHCPSLDFSPDLSHIPKMTKKQLLNFTATFTFIIGFYVLNLCFPRIQASKKINDLEIDVFSLRERYKNISSFSARAIFCADLMSRN